MLNEFCITFIKTFIFETCSTIVLFKSENRISIERYKKILILIINTIISITYASVYNLFELEKYNVPVTNFICYAIYTVSIYLIIESEKAVYIVPVILSITMSYISLFISTIMNFFIWRNLPIDISKNTIFEYITIGVVQVLLVYLFFNIKRFKYGFSFLKEKKGNNTNKFGVVIELAIIIISLLLSSYSRTVSKILAIILSLGGIAMFEWIKKSITKYYKEKMKDRTVEIQQEQIKEKDKKIDDLQTELSKVLEINHKYNHRLSAMERAVIKLGNEMQANTEFAEEYGDILDSLSELSKEYKAEIESINKTNKLPKTNIFSIDNLLDYMRQEAEKSKIEFKLEIEFDIKEIIENKIPKNKLETLLTDHIRDAIIAIENSENENRKIEVKFSNKEFYQVEFYDTGIEFEIETLLNIGLERTTTHKATGGTGIGFMTTFETLKECKASLEIEEFNNKEYTKAVIIGFDGKNEYRIHSYRAEEIKNKIQDNRIIID